MPFLKKPWVRWTLALLLTAATGLALLVLALDPWLRRTLEKQVTQVTHGQYRLDIGSLRTRLWARSLHLQRLVLRPAGAVADTLPVATVQLAQLDLHGVGLLALLRGQVVPVDSLVLDSLLVQVAALARRPAPHPAPPFYQQHPLRLGHMALRHASGSYGPAAHPQAAATRLALSARDLLLTPAGAQDAQRLFFAAAWQVALGPATAEGGGHRVALGGGRFASESGRLVLDSVRVLPVPGAGKPGAVQLWLQVPQATLAGLQAARWQHRHQLVVDSARLRGSLAFRPPAQAPPPLWQLIRPLARRVELGRLTIEDANFAVVGVAEKPAVQHIYATARAIRVDSGAARPGAGRVVYAQSWAGHTGQLAATLSPPVYPTSAEHLYVDTQARTLRLTGLTLRPTLSAAQLNLRNGYQLAQVALNLPVLRASDVDFGQLSTNSHVQAGAVVAERPVLQVSSDGRGPLNPNRSNLTPEALGKLRLHLDVRRVEVQQGTIVSLYRSPRSPLTGVFTLDKLHITLRNVSNDPRRMSGATPLRGEVTGLLQKSSPAHLWFTASTLDPLGRQHLWGTVGPASLGILNPMSRPTRLLAFEGQVPQLSLDTYLDQQRITGQVRATYSGLKLTFLHYKGGEVRKSLLNRVENGLINGLVLRDQNPRPGGRFVVGEVDLHREVKFSVFTAWKAALLDGMLRSAGVPAFVARKTSEASDHGALPAR